MPIKKRYLKSKPICKVTFTINAKEAKKATVVGTFNGWDYKKNPLNKLKNGIFKTVIDLEVGKTYEFRYLVDDAFRNEEEADGKVWSEFASAENCLLRL